MIIVHSVSEIKTNGEELVEMYAESKELQKDKAILKYLLVIVSALAAISFVLLFLKRKKNVGKQGQGSVYKEISFRQINPESQSDMLVMRI